LIKLRASENFNKQLSELKKGKYGLAGEGILKNQINQNLEEQLNKLGSASGREGNQGKLQLIG
jgi:hypothetical protein